MSQLCTGSDAVDLPGCCVLNKSLPSFQLAEMLSDLLSWYPVVVSIGSCGFLRLLPSVPTTILYLVHVHSQ